MIIEERRVKVGSDWLGSWVKVKCCSADIRVPFFTSLQLLSRLTDLPYYI